jgi:hypothetical protein
MMSHERCLRGRSGGPTSTTNVCAERRPGGPTFQCIPSVVAESRPQNVWVGLLARRCRACSAAASPSPADGRVVVRSSVLTHSGGTAPDLHRTSLLCPSRAPKQGLRYITIASQATNRRPPAIVTSGGIRDERKPIALLDGAKQTPLIGFRSSIHRCCVAAHSSIHYRRTSIVERVRGRVAR